MKITYGQLRSDNFKRAMGKIGNCPLFKNPRFAYRVAKISARLVEEAKLADRLYEKLVDVYAQKDEAGELQPFEGKPGTFFIPKEKQAEWNEKVTEYLGISFEVDRPALTLEDLAPAQLTPLEIAALEPLLVCEEDEDLGKLGS